MRGIHEKLSFVDQIAARILRVRLLRFLVGIEKIVCEFAAGEGIEKFKDTIREAVAEASAK